VYEGDKYADDKYVSEYDFTRNSISEDTIKKFIGEWYVDTWKSASKIYEEEKLEYNEDGTCYWSIKSGDSYSDACVHEADSEEGVNGDVLYNGTNGLMFLTVLDYSEGADSDKSVYYTAFKISDDEESGHVYTRYMGGDSCNQGPNGDMYKSGSTKAKGLMAIEAYNNYINNTGVSLDGGFALGFFDINLDGIPDMVFANPDSDNILSVDDSMTVHESESGGYDLYYTPEGLLVDLAGNQQAVGVVPDKKILQYNSDTGVFEVIHRFSLDDKDYSELDIDWENYDFSQINYDTRIFSYYVDGQEYSSYQKAEEKFKSFYDESTLKKVDAVMSSDSVMDAYDKYKNK
jgi:hypothetical protein